MGEPPPPPPGGWGGKERQEVGVLKGQLGILDINAEYSLIKKGLREEAKKGGGGGQEPQRHERLKVWTPC